MRNSLEIQSIFTYLIKTSTNLPRPPSPPSPPPPSPPSIARVAPPPLSIIGSSRAKTASPPLFSPSWNEVFAMLDDFKSPTIEEKTSRKTSHSQSSSLSQSPPSSPAITPSLLGRRTIAYTDFLPTSFDQYCAENSLAELQIIIQMLSQCFTCSLTPEVNNHEILPWLYRLYNAYFNYNTTLVETNRIDEMNIFLPPMLDLFKKLFRQLFHECILEYQLDAKIAIQLDHSAELLTADSTICSLLPNSYWIMVDFEKSCMLVLINFFSIIIDIYDKTEINNPVDKLIPIFAQLTTIIDDLQRIPAENIKNLKHVFTHLLFTASERYPLFCEQYNEPEKQHKLLKDLLQLHAVTLLPTNITHVTDRIIHLFMRDVVGRATQNVTFNGKASKMITDMNSCRIAWESSDHNISNHWFIAAAEEVYHLLFLTELENGRDIAKCLISSMRQTGLLDILGLIKRTIFTSLLGADKINDPAMSLKIRTQKFAWRYHPEISTNIIHCDCEMEYMGAPLTKFPHEIKFCVYFKIRITKFGLLWEIDSIYTIPAIPKTIFLSPQATGSHLPGSPFVVDIVDQVLMYLIRHIDAPLISAINETIPPGPPLQLFESMIERLKSYDGKYSSSVQNLRNRLLYAVYQRNQQHEALVPLQTHITTNYSMPLHPYLCFWINSPAWIDNARSNVVPYEIVSQNSLDHAQIIIVNKIQYRIAIERISCSAHNLEGKKYMAYLA